MNKIGGNEVLTSRYRRLLAYVPQGNQLMSGTVREIITFGDRSEMQNETDIKRALKTACADEFVREMENGIDTVVGFYKVHQKIL